MRKKDYAGLTKKLPNGKLVWTGVVRVLEYRLPQLLKVRKPYVWFVNSMSDLFHPDVPFSFVDKVFAVMALRPKHTFQILTKRPGRMLDYLTTWFNPDVVVYEAEKLITQNPRLFRDVEKAKADVRKVIFEQWPLPNVWLGTSVEDEKAARERIPLLQQVPARVRFLSCEPLIGPLLNMNLDDIHWVIVGGESGRKARPMQEEWVIDIMQQCKAAGVAFFFKQWGGKNKKKTGRCLLGNEWNEMPPLTLN
jgi:protein gp37